MRQRFHHVIVDCRQRDAQFVVDLAVGFLLEAVHPENTRRFFGQLRQSLLEKPAGLCYLNPVFLLGAARRIGVLDQWHRSDTAFLSADFIDQQVASDPE